MQNKFQGQGHGRKEAYISTGPTISSKTSSDTSPYSDSNLSGVQFLFTTEAQPLVWSVKMTGIFFSSYSAMKSAWERKLRRSIVSAESHAYSGTIKTTTTTTAITTVNMQFLFFLVVYIVCARCMCLCLSVSVSVCWQFTEQHKRGKCTSTSMLAGFIAAVLLMLLLLLFFFVVQGKKLLAQAGKEIDREEFIERLRMTNLRNWSGCCRPRFVKDVRVQAI